MAKVADRVKETTTTTGKGDVTLGGAVTGFKSFAQQFTSGDRVFYCITDGTYFEVGQGTFTNSSGTHTLSRTYIYDSTNYSSSNNAFNNKVDFGSGSKDVFVTIPASQQLYANNYYGINGLPTIKGGILNIGRITSADLGIGTSDQLISGAVTITYTRDNFTNTDPTQNAGLADSAYLYRELFKSRNDNDEIVTYAEMHVRMEDVSDGAIKGAFYFNVADGAITSQGVYDSPDFALKVGGDGIIPFKPVIFGTISDNRPRFLNVVNNTGYYTDCLLYTSDAADE